VPETVRRLAVVVGNRRPRSAAPRNTPRRNAAPASAPPRVEARAARVAPRDPPRARSGSILPTNRGSRS